MIVLCAEMDTAEVYFSIFEFCFKCVLVVTVMVPEAEMDTAEVILSKFQFCLKSDSWANVMV